MMSSIASLSALLLALPLFASATSVTRGEPKNEVSLSQCNVKEQRCCNSTQDAKSAGLSDVVAALLGADIDPIQVLVGLECTPVTVIGIAGNSCSAQPVCCNKNNYDEAVGINCTPINLNL